jgi:hypothetical protein
MAREASVARTMRVGVVKCMFGAGLVRRLEALLEIWMLEVVLER